MRVRVTVGRHGKRHDTQVSGTFDWLVQTASADSGLASRIGNHASEWVHGRYDARAQSLSLTSERVSDPTLVDLGIYRLRILANSVTGVSRTPDGNWSGIIRP